MEAVQREQGHAARWARKPREEAGGLVNLTEKSLGSAKKAGSSPLMGVYRYAERIAGKGLVFMDTPAYSRSP